MGDKKDVNKIVEKALETLGLDFKSLEKIDMENILPEEYPSKKIPANLNGVPAYFTIPIFQFLYLESFHLHEGYNQRRHLVDICYAIERKQFHHKKSKLVEAAWKDWKNFKKERWKCESELLSFRLRWRIRLKRLLSNLRFFLRF